MPRDGSNIYHYPTGIEGAPDTVIQSAPYNSFLADVEQDLNAPRPVLAGGTGATSADDALAALSGEKFGQVVTNYDSQVFVAGSFSSAASATASPVSGHAFAGIVYLTDSNNLVVEARDLDDTIVPPRKYVRQKKAGIWSTWLPDFDQITNDARYVNAAGDTMTGDLIINEANPTIYLKKPASGQYSAVNGSTADILRWRVLIGDATAETGSSAGSDFSILRYSDTGVLLPGIPFQIIRSSGNAFFGGGLTASNAIASQVTTTTGSYQFGTSGSKSLNYDGSNFNLNGGQLNVASGNITVPSGSVSALGYACRSGVSGSNDGNIFNFGYTGQVAVWINSTNLGNMTIASDYRVKRDVVNLPGMWDTVKSLRPIKYCHRDFTPPSAIAETTGRSFFTGDDIERWGFIAHELQATLTPSAATGFKDAPNAIQSPNPFTVIAALTKALQEAMTRIEALEKVHG